MNKGGWLYIVEASIAVVLILSALFVLYQRTTSAPVADVSEVARQILSEAAYNESLRRDIIQEGKDSSLKNFIELRLPEAYDFEVRICEVGDACGKLTPVDTNIYAAERVFSYVVEKETITPKKVRLFIWRKL